jgi:hypothetical protein
VIGLGWVVAHMVSNWDEARVEMQLPLQLSYLGLTPALYVLNLYWFYRVCITSAKVLRKRADAGDHKDD